MPRGIWVATLLISLSAFAEGSGSLGGRLVFRQGEKLLQVRDVQKLHPKSPMGIELRSGGQVVSAQLQPDGYFVASGPPGLYRFEYLKLGDQAEFFAPQQLELHEGKLTCAGTFELAMRDVEVELGTNQESTLTVVDGCRDAAPRLRSLGRVAGSEAVSLATEAPVIETPYRKSWIEYAVGLRAEYAAGSQNSALRASYALAVVGELGDQGSVVALLSAARVMQSGAGNRYEATAGVGYNLFGFLEAYALTGYRVPSGALTGGPVIGGLLRVGSYGFGLGLRGELVAGSTSDAPAVFLNLDLSPFYVLGSLL
jgi:hypothetical protein